MINCSFQEIFSYENSPRKPINPIACAKEENKLFQDETATEMIISRHYERRRLAKFIEIIAMRFTHFQNAEDV